MRSLLTDFSPLSDFPAYGVNRHGSIARILPGRSTFPGRILKARPGADGYMIVTLRKRPGKRVTQHVHILVARTFLGPIPEGKETNHRDLDKTHNAVHNLEYITHQENVEHWVKMRTAQQIAFLHEVISRLGVEV